MKKLIERITGDNEVQFLKTNYPETFNIDNLSSPVMEDMKRLCNQILDLKTEKRSNLHILNFRRSILSCFVSTFEIKQLRKAGWRISTTLWERCKRKRESDETFLDVDPVTKSGRKAVDASLKQEIEKLWIDNSRGGANCYVTNPENRNERIIGRRLTKPARHIIIESKLYKEKRASYGTIWRYRMW